MTIDVYFYHYYFVLCPFVFVLIAMCMLPWRRVLLALVLAQALMSYLFLDYIHQTGGTTRGEYGLSYALQVEVAKAGRFEPIPPIMRPELTPSHQPREAGR